MTTTHNPMTSGRARLEVNGATVARRPKGVTQPSHATRWVSDAARTAKQPATTSALVTLADQGVGTSWATTTVMRAISR